MTDSPDSFRLRDDVRWPGGVWFAETVDSTNAEALRRPAGSFIDGAVFWAAHQTAGRGRLGRRWEDRPGRALTVSLAFTAVEDLAAVQWLHLAVACAVVETAAGLLGQRGEAAAAQAARLGVKWPNDVVAMTDGEPGYLKLAGVLTEVQPEPAGTTGQRAALGVGINVNLSPDDLAPDVRERATSLARLAGDGREFDVRDVLQRLLDGLARRHAWIAAGNAAMVRDEMARLDVLRDAEVEVQLPASTLIGRAAGLDERARLRVVTADGTRHDLESGEVTRIRPRQ